MRMLDRIQAVEENDDSREEDEEVDELSGGVK